VTDFEAHAVFSHDSYDRTDQRKQWLEQRPVGLQSIAQIAYTTSGDGACASLAEDCTAAISWALPHLVPGDISTLDMAVGRGCVLVSLWDGGSASITLDGRQNVVLNVFLQGNGRDDALVLERREAKLRGQLLKILGGASTLLVDRFPRGSGRTTHYPKPDRIPLWY
jgi:hypothetical protein